ncbi:MAG: endonuclease/exonuclease/phosphatase family protein [Acidobacteria bacterium]|nr:endonuclease/exonuclease/phosphatase family protein [Acidobacteriota bacterium]
MTSAHQNQSEELRVLHWNIHSWQDDAGASNMEAVVNLVRATDPQVVSLVEVDESWGHPSALDEVADRCGYTSIFVPAFEFGKGSPIGGFGNALLSKLPILSVRQRQLVWPPRIFDGSEPSEARSVVFSKFQAGAGHMWIGSTHLPRSDTDSRVEAVQRLMVMIQELRDPWVLVGDFNMPATEWIDAYPHLYTYPTPAEPTHPTKEPIESIDYCVAPRAISVHVDVLSETGSDHRPIFVSCRLG